MAIQVPNPDADLILDAFKAANARGVFPTTLSTAELRGLAADARARAVFTARGANVHFLTKLKQVINAVASGEFGESGARAALAETLRALGYTPDGGFPDTAAGQVPPAIEGSIEDLSSFRRLDLMVRTQVDLMRGAGQLSRGMDADRLAAAPAFELVRVIDRRVPRDWQDRFEQVGGVLLDGRMILLKGDPRWGELGGSENFEDGLDVDYPPFAFNSGMGWDEIVYEDAVALGVTGPGGETVDEWLEMVERPMTLRGELPVAVPRLSMADADPEILKEWVDETSAQSADPNDPYAPGNYDFDAILKAELEAASKSYEKGGER